MSNDKLAQVLRDVLATLKRENERIRGPIVDTIWHGDAETLFDFIENTLEAHEAEKQAGPVAHLWQHGETGRTRIVMPDQVVTADANWFIVGPLYLHPAPPSPLTEQDKDDAGRYTIDEITEAVLYAEIPDGQFKSMLVSLDAIRAARAKKEQQ